MEERLTGAELGRLIHRVFNPGPRDRAVSVLVDLPDAELADNPRWAQRRETAARWVRDLRAEPSAPRLECDLVLYRNARRNNADLPESAVPWDPARPLPATANEVDASLHVPFAEVFRSHTILLAPTELSATAPLKLAARRYGFRAATMPGFSPAMIPALRLDYVEINRRVQILKDLLDHACGAVIRFAVEGAAGTMLRLDLRHRTAHASGGLLHEPGTAGNLPSGEAYIVPYEGEIPGDPSTSEGLLPVELDGEVVLYRVEANRAVAVESTGPVSRREAARLEREPAYGNLAELGLGVLSDFRIEPIGEVLLDEKLGLHVAFGRSDHFGGQVGAGDFSTPEAVVHQDRVYIPALQPNVEVTAADLEMEDGATLPLMRGGRYAVSFH
ncbi:MAG: hypothetical protein GXP47_01705 [Acidobacteria bacterium]|nr:hypothetical protein [Acidobacteriota bacterium]